MRRDTAVAAVAQGPSVPVLGPIRSNPSGGALELILALPARTPVRLEVWDVAGRLVRRFAEGERDAVSHELRWDGDDGRGVPVAPGLSFVHARRGEA